MRWGREIEEEGEEDGCGAAERRGGRSGEGEPD